MNLSTQLNDALNMQVIHELKNVLIYLQIASYFESLQLKKISSYFMKHADEEKSHADKFIAHINDRTGGNLVLSEVPFNSNPENFDINTVIELYVSTEEQTTESIESIYDVALDEKSFIDLPFILEMLKEQVEEEDIAQEFARKARNVHDLVLWDATF